MAQRPGKIMDHDACGIGAVVNIDGRRTHAAVSDALTIVEHLGHRAGKDASGEVGDGVGILLQICHRFFEKEAAVEGIALPPEGEYGIGMFFVRRDRRKVRDEGARLARCAGAERYSRPQGPRQYALDPPGLFGKAG